MSFGKQVIEKGQEADEEQIATGEGREVSSVEHMGTIGITIDVSHKNMEKFGYIF